MLGQSDKFAAFTVNDWKRSNWLCGRLKGCLSITVTFLHCQRPELLGYFSDLELMWIFANQLFQTFGDVVVLSIFVSSLHNCSGSCYWCTKPLPPVLPTFFGDSAEDTCSFQGIKCRVMSLAWKHLPPVVLEHKFRMSLSLQRAHQFLGAATLSAHNCFPLYH